MLRLWFLFSLFIILRPTFWLIVFLGAIWIDIFLFRVVHLQCRRLLTVDIESAQIIRFIFRFTIGPLEIFILLEKIIFIPHDSRPISSTQTADVVTKAGYEVVVPPTELLGSREDLGHPDQLWTWLHETIAQPGVKAAVISSGLFEFAWRAVL